MPLIDAADGVPSALLDSGTPVVEVIQGVLHSSLATELRQGRVIVAAMRCSIAMPQCSLNGTDHREEIRVRNRFGRTTRTTERTRQKREKRRDTGSSMTQHPWDYSTRAAVDTALLQFLNATAITAWTWPPASCT